MVTPTDLPCSMLLSVVHHASQLQLGGPCSAYTHSVVVSLQKTTWVTRQQYSHFGHHMYVWNCALSGTQSMRLELTFKSQALLSICTHDDAV